jgi:hypothetical protein
MAAAHDKVAKFALGRFFLFSVAKFALGRFFLFSAIRFFFLFFIFERQINTLSLVVNRDNKTSLLTGPTSA